MKASNTRDPGRDAFENERWMDAYVQLSAADGETSLGPEHLERLATAAYLVGKYTESADTWVRAHHSYLQQDDIRRAVQCACWLIFGLLNRGKRARAAGWIARARRLLGDEPQDCVEWGYLFIHDALQSLTEGDVERAYKTFCRAADIGEHCGDPNLIALARHSRGRLQIRMGAIQEGVGLLDEAMASVESGELSPMVVGDVYCSVIEGCMEIFDLQRAEEWTAAMSDWWAAQPDLIPYSGHCLVYRAEILQRHGAWAEAADAAQHAVKRLASGTGEPAAGEAFYRMAELHRLRGEFDRAEEAYREANRWGRKPHPGLARLRFYQDRIDAAEAAIRRAVDEATDRATRSRLLPAYIEIMEATGDTEAARGAVEELKETAGELNAPLLDAAATQAQGSVLLTEGHPEQAIPPLRSAWQTWRRIKAPYEAARVRVRIGQACRDLGDDDTADMEFDAARCIFRQLEASPDLEQLKMRSKPLPLTAATGLTEREIQVIRLVADGKTNRDIASTLYISEKTVARHVSNILSKLNVPNRAAATAYAYEHDIV